MNKRNTKKTKMKDNKGFPYKITRSLYGKGHVYPRYKVVLKATGKVMITFRSKKAIDEWVRKKVSEKCFYEGDLEVVKI